MVREKFMAFFLAICLALLAFPISLQAEGVEDTAPEISPDLPNGKRVLFDNTHGQTAGQADWVIDGAFSDFAEGIANNGYEVKELRQKDPINVGDLAFYDVFIIPEANIPFKKEEQAAIVEYVENGGSVFFISDHYNADRNKNRWDSSEIMNGFRRGAFDNPLKGMDKEERESKAMQNVESSDWLSNHFGIRFRYNAPGTIIADQVVAPKDSFNITKGISKVTMHAGSTLAITNPDTAKGIVYLPDNLDESDKWGPAVDEGIYHGGGKEEGPYVAISKLKRGKAAFIGDSSPVEDATPKYRNEETGKPKRTYDGFQEADNAELLLNMVDWLAKDEDYAQFSDTAIPLDDVSPMLEKELPINSTEPKKEPWKEPLAGYDWFDPLTFAPGAYGSRSDPVKDPSYQFKMEEPISNAEPSKVELIISGLSPGQTVSGYNVGMYLDGGMQVAKIKNKNGDWPSSYGYSEEFSLTANEGGIASKKLTIQVKKGVQGKVNLRLRKNSSKLYTTTVLVK
ncbi:DNA-binding protein [Virgibacillus proomii]|uniref:DNA-binding protein n=1 Tax=Virgibacillus proomii TaxID=84407 RepID=UPI001C1193ED|nr:DNA-binding protein [Virgibacillus proomii]MBU5267085.1 DNA-binding protein [Virgibacillus proomii]